MKARQATEPYSKLMWHHSAHQQWGKARLCFWRLSFNPTYNRQRVRAGIETVLDKHAVTSYLAYEILGHFDVLLRVWLPTSVTTDEMDLALYQELMGCDYHSSDFFEVTAVYWHWVWSTSERIDGRDTSRMLEPDQSDMIHPPLSEEELEALDQLVVASGGSRFSLKDLPEEARDVLALAEERHLVTTLNIEDGIKLFSVVSRPLGTLSKPARDEMSQRIRDIALSRDDNDEPWLKEVSVYAGQGFGSHIVAGRVHPAKFYSAVEHLTRKLNNLRVHEYKVRLYTYVTSEPNFLFYREGLGLSRAPEEVKIDDLLQSEEELNLEFKASAFSSLRSVIDFGETTFSRDTDLALSLAKTVGGFLNSADRGYLVVGVVEENAYVMARGRYASDRERDEAHERLKNMFPEYRPDLRISGLEPDSDLRE